MVLIRRPTRTSVGKNRTRNVSSKGKVSWTTKSGSVTRTQRQDGTSRHTTNLGNGQLSVHDSRRPKTRKSTTSASPRRTRARSSRGESGGTIGKAFLGLAILGGMKLFGFW